MRFVLHGAKHLRIEFLFQLIGVLDLKWTGNLPGFLKTDLVNVDPFCLIEVSKKWSGFSSTVK